MMNQLKLRIRRLVETGAVTDDAEKQRLQILLTTKKFNPYCLRHSSISHDSDYLPDYALKKKVRWSMNSKQPSRYIKTRMGNDLKQKILIQNGIISETDGKPKPNMSECPRCNLVNAIEDKYCFSCSYPLVPSAFEEIKEEENMKFSALEERFNGMQSMLEEVIAGLSKTTDQHQVNTIAQSMFSSGILKSTKGN